MALKPFSSQRLSTRRFNPLNATPTPLNEPYFPYTTLLLSGNGTNGAQNNTFLDGSTNNFTITRNGNTTQGTFSPFSQTGWGYYVPEQVSNQVNFTTSAGTDFQFAGDFTIEGWLYAANNSGDGSFYVISDNVNYLAFNISISANVFNIYLNNSTPVAITSDIPLATWTHVAMVRSGSGSGNIKLYTNGVLKGSTTNTSTLGYANPVFSRIGGGVAGIDRYYSNLRICKSAVYTGAFTPSTIPLTTTSQSATNCVLLTANSNRFLNQAVGATATITGSPRVVAFSPFNPTASWSAATYGGSGYFDGSGDYLNLTIGSTTIGSGDFTIELWYYPITFENYDTLFSTTRGANGFNIGTNASKSLVWYSSSAEQINAGSLVQYAWNHIAFTRTSNSLRAYINGSQVGATPTVSTNFSATNCWVGDLAAIGGEPSHGYISGLRVVTQSLSSGATYTVPTAPLTAITNTSLLLNFTNAGIYDATSKNDLETVGNAQISTAISAKWGSGSMYFDGTGDYLVAPTTNLPITFGTGDFTIEGWIYPASVSGAIAIVSNRFDAGADTVLIFAFGTTYGLFFHTNATSVINSGTNLTVNTWQHIALSRASGTVRIFLNGTQVGSSASSAQNLSSTAAMYVGQDGVKAFGTAAQLNGYLQDLRITKGYARYTANFTPPTAAFPTL